MSVSTPTSPPAPANNRLPLRFLAVAVVLYLLWFVGYEQRLAPDGRLDEVLCRQIASASMLLLRATGFAASILPEAPHQLLIRNMPAVYVGPACNGLVMYALFAGFVVAYPGPWLRKLWYIPTGIVIIWLLNVLRVAALAINVHYAYSSVDFNHHYTFNLIVYSCIFGLWLLWVRRLSGPVAPATAEVARG